MPISISGDGPITGITSLNTTVSSAELEYLDGTTSAIQTQINTKPTGGTGAWTSYTPTWSGLTLGNGTSTGAYTQIGKTVFFRAKVSFGSTSSLTGSGIQPSFPVPVSSGSSDSIFMNAVSVDAGSRYYPLMTIGNTIYAMNASSTYLLDQTFTSTIPFTWNTNDAVWVSGVYEAA